MESEWQSFIKSYCIDCHGPDKQKADIRLDALDSSFKAEHDYETWYDAFSMLRAHDMPPDSESQPTDTERVRITQWLNDRLERAAESWRQSHPRNRLRRLTKDEYNHTLQDIFGVKTQFASILPPDPISQSGYQNDISLLNVSTLQMEYYLEIARQSVGRYIVFESPTLEPFLYHIKFEDLFYTVRDRTHTHDRAPDPLTRDEYNQRRAHNRNAPLRHVPPLTPNPPGDLPTVERLRASQPKLNQQFLPIKSFVPVGDIIVRVRAAGTPDRHGSYPRLRVECGVAYGDGDGMDTKQLGEIDVSAPLGQPATYEFRARMEDVPTHRDLRDTRNVFDMLQLFISNDARDEKGIYELGLGSYTHPEMPGVEKNPNKIKNAERERTKVMELIEKMSDNGVSLLHLDAVEIEIIPTLGSANTPKWLVEYDSSDPDPKPRRAAARAFLERFMPQAYRRSIANNEIDEKLTLFNRFVANKFSFEQSLRKTAVAVLVSPHFLLLEVPPDTESEKMLSSSKLPTPHHIAERLSYLLWGTMPDDRLSELANSGKMADRKTLETQAQRLIADSHIDRFLENFCHQWLRLDKFSLIAVNPEHYPNYDDDLGQLTLQETIAYFKYVFHNNANAVELLDSDYAMLNQRLAQHYKLPNVIGHDLQKVKLPPDSPHGGLITQASLLTINSNGVDAHPIRRGNWIINRLLNDPAPPPPPDVSDIDENDPDFRGLTLKQQIERHRDSKACNKCHRKIDPWGLALENFDATGRWRDTIQILNNGTASRVNVDASTRLPDGTQIDGARKLKQYLLQHRNIQFTRSLTEHMLSYALGRPLDFSDQADVDILHAKFTESGFHLRSLLLEIVTSDAFLR